jgi:hypothetical protein
MVIILMRILVALFLVVILIPYIYHTKILKIVRHWLDGIKLVRIDVRHGPIEFGHCASVFLTIVMAGREI